MRFFVVSQGFFVHQFVNRMLKFDLFVFEIHGNEFEHRGPKVFGVEVFVEVYLLFAVADYHAHQIAFVFIVRAEWCTSFFLSIRLCGDWLLQRLGRRISGLSSGAFSQSSLLTKAFDVFPAFFVDFFLNQQFGRIEQPAAFFDVFGSNDIVGNQGDAFDNIFNEPCSSHRVVPGVAQEHFGFEANKVGFAFPEVIEQCRRAVSPGKRIGVFTLGQ